MGTAGEAAKDQRVVVVLPPKVPAAKTMPPARDERPRSRSPNDRRPRTNYDRDALPQRPLIHQEEPRHRSASRSAYDRKEKEMAAKDKEERRYREPFRQRSPSPRPSTSRHHHSLPRSMPSLATGNAEEIQWMVAAMTAAFTASQQFRSRHHSSDRRPPSPRRSRSPSPSSSHRSRSYHRKGKGPGRGKGGRR